MTLQRKSKKIIYESLTHKVQSEWQYFFYVFSFVPIFVSNSLIINKKHTFILSDESVNSYGFKVITNGINLDSFRKNPVMYYMHERESGIIGRWENIRIEGQKLLADAVFDETIPLGKSVKKRVENGFIRAASIGVGDAVKECLNGVETVIYCTIRECSIVDIPANKNAVKLFVSDDKFVYNLSEYEKKIESNKALNKKLCELLKLPVTVSDDVLFNEIKKRCEQANQKESQAKRLLDEGAINSAQYKTLQYMELYDKKGFYECVKEVTQQKIETIKLIALSGCNLGKYTFSDCQMFEKVGNKIGIEDFKRLISAIPKQVRITELIKGENTPEKQKDLDWYRRNDPDFLRKNPKEYRHLLEIELNK